MRKAVKIGGAAAVAGAVVAAVVITGGAATGQQDGRASGPANEAFAAAAAEFDVPRDLVVAVGYGETHLDGHAGEPSQDNGYGVMHLVSNPTRHTLEQAAELTGDAGRRSCGPTPRPTSAAAPRCCARWPTPTAWTTPPATGSAPGTRSSPTTAAPPTTGSRRLYADTVYEFLGTGVEATAGSEQVASPRRPCSPEHAAGSPGSALDDVGDVRAMDYPNAHLDPGQRRQLRRRPLRGASPRWSST